MAAFAHGLGLEVHAGHGLTFDNVGPVAALPRGARAQHRAFPDRRGDLRRPRRRDPPDARGDGRGRVPEIAPVRSAGRSSLRWRSFSRPMPPRSPSISRYQGFAAELARLPGRVRAAGGGAPHRARRRRGGAAAASRCGRCGAGGRRDEAALRRAGGRGLGLARRWSRRSRTAGRIGYREVASTPCPTWPRRSRSTSGIAPGERRRAWSRRRQQHRAGQPGDLRVDGELLGARASSRNVGASDGSAGPRTSGLGGAGSERHGYRGRLGRAGWSPPTRCVASARSVSAVRSSVAALAGSSARARGGGSCAVDPPLQIRAAPRPPERVRRLARVPAPSRHRHPPGVGEAATSLCTLTCWAGALARPAVVASSRTSFGRRDRAGVVRDPARPSTAARLRR